jgi:hypothetical protein
MHFRHPVAQAVENHASYHRMVSRQGVAAAAVVGVVDGVFFENVVGFVVNALEIEGRAFVVTLGRVVKHHIQNDLNALFVQGFNHISKLVDRPHGIFARTVAPVGSKKGHGAVAPVIFQPWAHILGIKLVNGQQLYSGDAKDFR